MKGNLIKLTITALAITSSGQSIRTITTPPRVVYSQAILPEKQQTIQQQYRSFSSGIKSIDHYREMVMNDLDIKEWMRRRFNHELKKNQNNEEIVKIYNFYLELLDSDYFYLEQDWNKLKDKMNDSKYVQLTALCVNLRTQARQEIEHFANQCQEFEKQGCQIKQAGPEGIQFARK
jgi:septal ring factor EnvC (AmiA/AmiB activator)